MAVFAPTPMAIDSAAAMVKPGVRRKLRIAYRRSPVIGRASARGDGRAKAWQLREPLAIFAQCRGGASATFDFGDRPIDEVDAGAQRERPPARVERRQIGVLRDGELERAAVAEFPAVVEPAGARPRAGERFPER